MGGRDHLVIAVDVARGAETYDGPDVDRATQFAEARTYALLSIAESLRELANRPYPVPSVVEDVELDDRTYDDPIPYRLAAMPDRDALIRTAAGRIDSIGRAGEAAPLVHDAGRLGLDYAKHWPTVVAIDTALTIVASLGANQAATPGGGPQ